MICTTVLTTMVTNAVRIPRPLLASRQEFRDTEGVTRTVLTGINPIGFGWNSGHGCTVDIRHKCQMQGTTEAPGYNQLHLN